MKQYSYLLIIILAGFGCGNHPSKSNTSLNTATLVVNSRVFGVGKIEPESNIIQLSSSVTGIVKKIYKNENDSVKTGEIVLELTHSVEDAQVNQLLMEVKTHAEQIKVDEAAVQEYQVKYTNAVSEVKRLKSLLVEGAETQQAVDNASTDMQSFSSNLKRLQASAGVSKSKLSETRAALEVSQRELDQKIIRSPVDGKVLEISALIGGAIDAKTPFAQISPIGKIIADCEVDEQFANKISVGQKAVIRNTGALDTLSTGTVYFTSSFLKKKSLFTDQAGEKEDRRVRDIKIVLDRPGKLLLNARVECVIDITGDFKK